MELKDVKRVMLSGQSVKCDGALYRVAECHLKLGKNRYAKVDSDFYYALYLQSLKQPNSYIVVRIEDVEILEREKIK